MQKLRVSLTFLKSLAGLSSQRLRKIPRFLQMLQSNPHLPSLHFEHLATVDLYSARIDDGYRAILGRHGDDYVLIRASKHEEAYRRAEQDADSSESIGFPVELDVAIAPGTAGQEDSPPPQKPRPSPPADDTSSRLGALQLGSIHTWNELKQRFAWDPEERCFYLPEAEGHIVCACLQAKLNPSAPWEILVGKGPSQMHAAELLAQQVSPIPVFIKQATNQWEYWGRFRFERCEKDPDKIRPVLPANRREDTSMVLYLAEVE
jgi:mRNA-degrading endonuclease RelE of RelBE toxin-antitoxin system